ncbi:VOC family protein [Caldalkalibacillus salinus]|uniref:VOC family protein n=1 Tax=Caldalkalibacillus salinus TaxID=2803787 RepID=UPI0019235C8B|nr:VOC family protein [Caldalkalibacillus salinus]
MIKGFHHTGVKVSDMERSIAFYEKTFQLEVTRRTHISEDTELCFLSFPDSPGVSVELICEKQQAEPLGEGQVHHLAFRVSNIEEEMSRLKSSGLSFSTEAPIEVLGGLKVAFTTGPDDEILELVEE